MIDKIKREDTILISADVHEGVAEEKLRSRITGLVRIAVWDLMKLRACWERVQDYQDIDVAMFKATLTIECDRPPQPDDEEDED